MKCKEKTEVFSRVVGYYRPIKQWNMGKQEEYFDRTPYKIGDSPARADRPLREYPGHGSKVESE